MDCIACPGLYSFNQDRGCAGSIIRGCAESLNRVKVCARGFAASLAVSLWLTGSLPYLNRGYASVVLFHIAEGITLTEAEPLETRDSPGKPEAYRKEGGKAASRFKLDQTLLKFIGH